MWPCVCHCVFRASVSIVPHALSPPGHGHFWPFPPAPASAWAHAVLVPPSHSHKACCIAGGCCKECSVCAGPNCFPALQLRRLVSTNKRRYENNDFKLDLIYLTDHVLVHGFPAVGPGACPLRPSPSSFLPSSSTMHIVLTALPSTPLLHPPPSLPRGHVAQPALRNAAVLRHAAPGPLPHLQLCLRNRCVELRWFTATSLCGCVTATLVLPQAVCTPPMSSTGGAASFRSWTTTRRRWA